AHFAQMRDAQQQKAQWAAAELVASDNGIFRYDDEIITFAREDLQLTNKRLGRGSGTVLRGTFMTQKRELEVAVKKMREISPKGRDKGRSLTSMIREAVVARRATIHDNVVRLYGFVIEDFTCYMVMELMAANLDEVKIMAHERETLNAARLESFLGCATVGVVNALTFLWKEVDVIHIDIKPNNIMISEAGDVKLCVFGESKKLVSLSTETRNGHTHHGCIKYMA
ncbi:hypothetical protein PFISCL1PPCAC_16847, partial [Pristionchus fissidentatus]